MHRNNPKVFRTKGPTATGMAIAELSKSLDLMPHFGNRQWDQLLLNHDEYCDKWLR